MFRRISLLAVLLTAACDPTSKLGGRDVGRVDVNFSGDLAGDYRGDAVSTRSSTSDGPDVLLLMTFANADILIVNIENSALPVGRHTLTPPEQFGSAQRGVYALVRINSTGDPKYYYAHSGTVEIDGVSSSGRVSGQVTLEAQGINPQTLAAEPGTLSASASFNTLYTSSLFTKPAEGLPSW